MKKREKKKAVEDGWISETMLCRLKYFNEEDTVFWKFSSVREFFLKIGFLFSIVNWDLKIHNCTIP